MFTTDERNKHFKGLLYGRPGTGKTYSVRTIPNPSSVIFIAAEPGTLTIRDYKLALWEVAVWKDFEDMYQELMSKDYHDKRAKNGHPPLETIFIDSLTEITKKAVDHVLKERDDVMAQRGKVKTTIFEDQMTIEEWGVVKPRIERMIRAFRDLPYNVIFTALEDNVKDKDGAMTVTALMSPKSLSLEIPGLFDEVFHSDQVIDESNKTITRWWDTVDAGTIRAKDRSSSLPPKMVQDWGKVFDAINNSKEKS